jgi:hypothetical protein
MIDLQSTPSYQTPLHLTFSSCLSFVQAMTASQC